MIKRRRINEYEMMKGMMKGDEGKN